MRKEKIPNNKKCDKGNHWTFHKIHWDSKRATIYYDGLFSCSHDFKYWEIPDKEEDNQ